MSTICLVTTGQPSTNPRLVKEANALSEAGHEVNVVCAHWADWADIADTELLKTANYKVTYVGNSFVQNDLENAWRGLRHRLGHRLSQSVSTRTGYKWALSRISPDLFRAAKRIRADLYIAHNIGALPSTFEVAKRNGAMCGFDAEDFHSGMTPFSRTRDASDRIIERFEKRTLSTCAYVTAASPMIAEHYSRKYSISTPTTILNVFSLSDRPEKFAPAESSGTLRLYWFSQTIGPGRGIEEIIKAMALVPNNNIGLTLLGKIEPHYRRTLSDLVTGLGLPVERLNILQPASPSKMVRIASEHDVGLALEQPDSLNREICLTNKIFTYLLAGNAVLATATRAQQKFFDEIPGTGKCCDPQNIDAFAECLSDWSKDRSSLIRSRRASWDFGTARFNWDIEKYKFLAVIDRALERKSAAAA